MYCQLVFYLFFLAGIFLKKNYHNDDKNLGKCKMSWAESKQALIAYNDDLTAKAVATDNKKRLNFGCFFQNLGVPLKIDFILSTCLTSPV